MLDVNQAAELKFAFRRNGWNNVEIKTLSEGDILADVLKVIKGQAEIRIIERLIDCDSAPFIPDGWSVEKHKKGGMFKFNPGKISLYLSKKQKKGGTGGHYLRKELSNKPVMNANVLDYLLTHPELIPEEWKWKGKCIFFWGTIYRSYDGLLLVRYLSWNGSEWYWDYFWLGRGFYSSDLAALAS
ncbi:TPA: hypothetical protein DCZ15_01415 [Candidatus Falkowbacteria bacterium]|nr:MAG: hypothetical protein UV95_C0003G0145 [Candidatus Falkowbacteria bacterium GW2011_GWF2_43_32]HBA36514.1 hypothetical protein [Candidatus Falkowbacteria bacterium]